MTKTIARLPNSFFSIRTRLIVTFLVGTFVTLSMVLIFNQAMQAQLIEKADDALLVEAQLIARQLDDFNTRHQQALQVASRLPVFTDYIQDSGEHTSAETRNTLVTLDSLRFTQFNQFHPLSYALLDAHGVNIVDTRQTNIGADESQQPYFTVPYITGQAFISPLYYQTDRSGIYYYFSVPIRLNTVPATSVGVLRTIISVSTVQDIVFRAARNSKNDIHVMLLDEHLIRIADTEQHQLLFRGIAPLTSAETTALQGQLLLPPLPNENLFTPLPELSNTIAQMNGNAILTGNMSPGDTDLKRIAVTRLESTNWYIVLAQPLSQYYFAAHHQQAATLALGLALVGAALIFSIVLSDFITKPIRKLTHAAARVSQGDLTVRAAIRTRSELGTLAQTFNQMTADLERMTGTLEQRVQERTQALQQAYDDLRRETAERQQAELALRHSEERLRALVEALPDRAIILSADGRYVDVIKQYAYVNDLTFRTDDDIIGKSVYEVFPIDFADFCQDIIHTVLESNHQQIVEYTALHHSNQHYEGRIVPIQDAETGEPQVLWIMRDITERKQAEERLKYFSRFQTLLVSLATEFINLPLAEIDAYINRLLQQVGEFMGADRSYIFRFSPDLQSVTMTHEWCASDVEPFIDKFQNSVLTGYSWVIDQYKQSKTLNIQRISDIPPEASPLKQYWIRDGIQSLVAVPLMYRGVLIGAMGFHAVHSEKYWSEETVDLLKIAAQIYLNAIERKQAEDALRESEQQYRNLLEQAPIALVVWVQKNDAFQIVYANAAGANLYGAANREMLLGKVNTDFGSEIESHELAHERYHAYFAGHDPGLAEYVIHRLDGRVAQIVVGSIPINFEGQPALLTVMRDVTEQRHAEAAALEFQQKLRQVHEISIELAQQTSLVNIYRRAVELGRSVLGFDRLGLWVLNSARDKILGTFGTDDTGQVRDERQHAFPLEIINPDMLAMFERHERIVSHNSWFISYPGFDIGDDDWNKQAALWTRVALLWNGSEGIGWLSTDNYVHKAEPRPYEFDLLTIYATALGSLITQRQAEENALAFQEKLRQIHGIAVELSQEKTLTDIYRRAVELGRSALDFDRFALFLIVDETQGVIRGTFGTDVDGQIRDESDYSPKLADDDGAMTVIRSKERAALWENTALKDSNREVGTGWTAMAALWNGSKAIGWLVIDNLLSQQPPRHYELDLLTVYATALGSLITQRQAEETALAFQEKLRQIHDIAVELSQEKTLTDIYRRAVELGRNELGFDRLGLWLMDKNVNVVEGTFGTDEAGQLRDESAIKHFLPDDFALLELLNSKQRNAFWEQRELQNHQLETVAYGWKAVTFLWNGVEDIGCLSSDNFLSKRPPRTYEMDLLTVYGTSLGHLITQRQTQEALQHSEETALEFQQKLRQVHEITIELAQQPSLTDIYRRAVELGRSELGFDRLGLWVLNPSRDMVMGTFGTDKQGQTRDEQHLAFSLEDVFPEVLDIFKRKERIISQDGGVIDKGAYEIDPTGWNSVAILWNGTEGIGWLSADNYLNKAPVRPYERDLLTIYATALGSLITQRQAEAELKSYRDHLEELVDLRTDELKHEIVERQQTQEALHASLTKLAAANEELEAFSYTVSHDLRAPLRALNNYSLFIQEDCADILSGDCLDYVQGIAESAQQMEGLVVDLLDYSRINHVKVSISEIDVRELLEELAARLHLREHATVSLPPDLPMIRAKKVRLEQIFSNLLSNALKFRRADTPLAIAINWSDQPDYWAFSVQDNGIGIAEKYVDKIFGIFQRLHTQEEYEGTGIGLAIVDKAVKEHLGQVVVQSELGKGSIFTFTISKHLQESV